jgi:hypothetical protein
MPSSLFDYVPGSFHTMGECNPSSVGKRFSFTMPRGSKWTLNLRDDARAREFYCPPEDKTGPIPMPVIPAPVTNVPGIDPGRPKSQADCPAGRTFVPGGRKTGLIVNGVEVLSSAVCILQTNTPPPPPPTAPTPVKPAPVATCRQQEFNPRTGALMGLVQNPGLCGMTGGCVRIGDCTYRDLPRLVNPPFEMPSVIALPPSASLGSGGGTIRPSPITPGGRLPGPGFYDLGPGGGVKVPR